jgi:hypothetical protein
MAIKLNQFPVELLEYIISFLNNDDIIKMRSVSRIFYNLKKSHDTYKLCSPLFISIKLNKDMMLNYNEFDEYQYIKTAYISITPTNLYKNSNELITNISSSLEGKYFHLSFLGNNTFSKICDYRKFLISDVYYHTDSSSINALQYFENSKKIPNQNISFISEKNMYEKVIPYDVIKNKNRILSIDRTIVNDYLLEVTTFKNSFNLAINLFRIIHKKYKINIENIENIENINIYNKSIEIINNNLKYDPEKQQILKDILEKNDYTITFNYIPLSPAGLYTKLTR